MRSERKEKGNEMVEEELQAPAVLAHILCEITSLREETETGTEISRSNTPRIGVNAPVLSTAPPSSTHQSQLSSLCHLSALMLQLPSVYITNNKETLKMVWNNVPRYITPTFNKCPESVNGVFFYFITSKAEK